MIISDMDGFQFLGRNSGRSDLKHKRGSWGSLRVSIPRSEFWSFGRRLFAYVSTGHEVSIPRSEFWSFGLNSEGASREMIRRVSIPRSEFWSFGLPGIGNGALDCGVSIPRSEFWSFGPHRAASAALPKSYVSIPRSEFWSFGPHLQHVDPRRHICFNSSVGILVVRTCTPCGSFAS